MWTVEHRKLLEDTGAVCVPSGLPVVDLAVLREELAPYEGQPGARLNRPGDAVTNLVGPSGALGRLASSILANAARPVRVLVFDKSERSNWSVPWHQDRTIAVAGRAKVAGFQNWTMKRGTQHVEPPFEIIERMITLRLHLDDCQRDNGPLQTISGSHRLGKLNDAGTKAAVADGEGKQHTALEGDILVLRTSIIHASPSATRPARRRVLHVEFSPDELPASLEWALIL
ncbi:phytanoyl-CoA dioxygenase family protein [Hyphobacterium sp.]|uniref:phytanoyl-CoA dioxygenase family protein n=1 Tax=Hyphobacterium sp. TaxID=2004662 RepID=UPI003747A21A